MRWRCAVKYQSDIIIWTDLETTGLDPHEGSILEIAMVATDGNLQQIGAPFVSIVQPLHLRGYEVMDAFVVDMHIKNGLMTDLYDGVASIADEKGNLSLVGHPVLRDNLPRLGDVERAAIDWIKSTLASCNCLDRAKAATGSHDLSCASFIEWKKEAKGIPLGGNTVHFDKRWMIVHMDDLEALFSHRIVDVSSFTEMAKRIAKPVYNKRPGLGPDGKPLPTHRALPDIRSSIATLLYYEDAGFLQKFVEPSEIAKGAP